MSGSWGRFLYFAYGASLNIAQMRKRCPAARSISRAYLYDYELEFRNSPSRGYGIANASEKEGVDLPGGVWSVTPECLRVLDRHKSYPRLYGRKYEYVMDEHKVRHKVIVYYMHPGYELAPPDPDYLLMIARGYKDFKMTTNDYKCLLEGVRKSGEVTEKIIDIIAGKQGNTGDKSE